MIGFHLFKTKIDPTRAITEKKRKDTCKQTHDSVKKIAEMSIRSREERARGVTSSALFLRYCQTLRGSWKAGSLTKKTGDILLSCSSCHG